MATGNPNKDIGKQFKEQLERKRKGAPLFKATVAKGREEDRQGFEDLRRRRGLLEDPWVIDQD